MEWGFAPYGYYLKDKQLFIQEEEAEVIRIIYDKFANSSMGYGGVAQILIYKESKKFNDEWETQ
jgi:hypothetical protein